MSKTISGIVWQPIDPQNLPQGQIIALLDCGRIYSGWVSCWHGKIQLEDVDGYRYAGITHYAHITPLQLPSTETLEAEMKAEAERHNARRGITRVVFEQGFRAALEVIQKFLSNS